MARAFGSSVELNVKGWELGVRTIELTDIGKKLLLGENADKADSIVSSAAAAVWHTIDSWLQTIHQVHRDHVPKLPDNFALLGSTSVCAIQGMVRPASASKLSDVKIFCLQGHPEFSPDIVTEIINVREAKGILNKELADKSREYAAMHDEGVGIGATILRIIGV